MLKEIMMNINWTQVLVTLITIFVPASLIAIKIRSYQNQKSGNNSKNFQANGDINININKME